MSESRRLSDSELEQFRRRLDRELKPEDVEWIADEVVRKIRETFAADIVDYFAEFKVEITDEILSSVRKDFINDHAVRESFSKEIADRVLERKSETWSKALDVVWRMVVVGGIVLLLWRYVIQPLPVWFPFLIGLAFR